MPGRGGAPPVGNGVGGKRVAVGPGGRVAVGIGVNVRVAVAVGSGPRLTIGVSVGIFPGLGVGLLGGVGEALNPTGVLVAVPTGANCLVGDRAAVGADVDGMAGVTCFSPAAEACAPT